MAAVTWLYARKKKSSFRQLNTSTSKSGTAQTVIAAPSAGSCIVIDRIIATVDTDDALLSLYASSDEDGNRIVYNKFKSESGVLDYNEGRIALPAATALSVTVSAGNVYYVIWYHLEPVN